MRLKSIVVLATISLLVHVDSAPITSSQLDSAVVNNPEDVFSQRFLRSYETLDKVSEERAGLDALMAKLFGPNSLKTFLRQNKSGVDVLNALKFGDDVTAALKNSKLDELKTYITMFNKKKKPKKPLSLIGVFTTRYGDDAVARALVEAKKNAVAEPEVAKLASELRTELLSKWLKDGQSTDEVFKLLKLDKGGYIALISPKMELLDDYIVKFNTDKQGKETMLQTLTKGLEGENKLVSIIAAAKLDFATAKKARALEKGLFTKWQGENLDPAGVLKLLKLDDDVKNVLNNDNFRTFEKYVTVWNENSSNTKTTVLEILTTKYGDVAVARALVTAREARETERTALKLQNELFGGWLKSEMTVDDAFKFLRMNEDGFEAIGNRKLETLDGYIKLFNHEKSGDETLLNALTIGFGTETKLAAILLKAEAHKVYPRMEANAKKLQNVLFKKWLDEGLDSVDSVLVQKYKIAATNVDTATDMQRAVAKQFAKYYENTRGN